MELQTTTDTVENGAADSKELSSFLVSWVNHEGEQENGPLSVLWQLIESYRVDIFDISLQRITEEFYPTRGRTETRACIVVFRDGRKTALL